MAGHSCCHFRLVVSRSATEHLMSYARLGLRHLTAGFCLGAKALPSCKLYCRDLAYSEGQHRSVKVRSSPYNKNFIDHFSSRHNIQKPKHLKKKNPHRIVRERKTLSSKPNRGGYPLSLDLQATRPISPSNPPLLRKFHYRTTKVPECDLQQNSIFKAIALQISTFKLWFGQSEKRLCTKTWSNQVHAVSVRQHWNVKCLRYI